MLRSHVAVLSILKQHLLPTGKRCSWWQHWVLAFQKNVSRETWKIRRNKAKWHINFYTIGETLPDKRSLSKKGQLTTARIDTTQGFYGLALCQNKGNLMKIADTRTLFLKPKSWQMS